MSVTESETETNAIVAETLTITDLRAHKKRDTNSPKRLDGYGSRSSSETVVGNSHIYLKTLRIHFDEPTGLYEKCSEHTNQDLQEPI